MTPEQKAAFINAQSVLMQAAIQMMLAENQERERKGQAPANGPDQWAALISTWEPILGYNALITFFCH